MKMEEILNGNLNFPPPSYFIGPMRLLAAVVRFSISRLNGQGTKTSARVLAQPSPR